MALAAKPLPAYRLAILGERTRAWPGGLVRQGIKSASGTSVSAHAGDHPPAWVKSDDRHPR
jgi:hypothetical protein